MNTNSTLNQDIKSKFVNTHVLLNMNEFIQEMQKNESSEWQDEIMSVSSSPDYEAAIDNSGYTVAQSRNSEKWFYWKSGEFDTIRDALEHQDFDTEEEAQRECIDNANLDYDYVEAYEFYAVSGYLAHQLKERGQMVEVICGVDVWGRCATGQAILLDAVISNICEDMGILDG